jgi:hypothetical protein
MGWDNFHSIWDEPVDGDDNTANSAKKKKKLSWWDEFEREPTSEASGTEKADADRYSYRDAFDDSDSRWYRRNSFDYSRYSDYSPSRLFRSTFRSTSIGFGAGLSSYASSADNELKNKAIRALRVLTRNANTVADKSAKISYVVRFSDGVDTNQPVAESVAGKSGKQQEQVIFISPNDVAKATTPDEDDAAIDALTGFVLLRVQIAQSVPKTVLDDLNGTAMTTLPAKIASMAANKALRTPAEAKLAAATHTDIYSAGLIAKNLLTRISRRGVVQDWGGFAPYFVRHAKKFAAIREKLTAEGAVESVELLSAQIAYNMLADDSQIPMAKEVEAIVEKHLSAEIPYEDVLATCQDLVADLRAYLIAKSEEQPPAGDLESAMEELFNELAAENNAADDEDAVEAGMRDNLENLASLLDSLYEASEQNKQENRFGETAAPQAAASNAAGQLQFMDKARDAVASTLVNIEEGRKDSAGEPVNPSQMLHDLLYQQSMLDSSFVYATRRCGELLNKHSIEPSGVYASNNRPNKSSDARIQESYDKYAANLEEMLKKLDAAIKAETSSVRDNIKKAMAELAKHVAAEEKQLDELIEKAREIAEKSGKLSSQHAHGPAVDGVVQKLLSELSAYTEKLRADREKLEQPDKLNKVRSPTSLKKAADNLARVAATASYLPGNALNNTTHSVPSTPMRNFVYEASSTYSNACKNGRSMRKMPTGWHARAIEEVMNGDAPEEVDFESSVVSAAHKDMLDKLINKLTANGKGSLPTSARGSETSAEQKEALKRAASAMGMADAADLLNMLHRIKDAAFYGRTNPQANKLGKDIEEKIVQLAEANSPVDEELFGKEVSNTTSLAGASIVGVNDEALNRAEEEYVAYLSHNEARPIIRVKQPPKRGPDIVRRTLMIKKQNRVAIEGIRNALRFQSDKRVGEVHGLLSGDLDEGSLHKLQYDSEHIWSQKTIAKLPDVAVGILVDQSGSMSAGGKIDNAREMCIVLAEAVKQINGVHLHIYGHTANQHGSSDLTLFEHYSSYGDAKSADLTNLGAIAAYSNNYDGYAIKEAAKRLNLDPAKRKYLFIIADGFPAGSGYGGEQAEKHVTSVCSYVRTKLDISTYAFAVGNNSVTERKRFEAQYGKTNVVFISTVRQALPKIVRFLRNALQKEKTLVDISAD